MKSLLLYTNHIIAIQFLIIAFLLPSPATSQSSTPPPPSMSSKAGLAILIFTISIFSMSFVCICLRHCNNSPSSNSASLPRHSTIPRGTRGGVTADVIDTFPTFDFLAVKALKIGKGGVDCAVCLNEFEDDETLRLIPVCDHVFHADCIDLWLEAHATCPVCRAYLVPDSAVGKIQNDAVAVEVLDELQPAASPGQSMEQPLNPPWLVRSRTRGNASGRRRWFGMVFARSHSTGHVSHEVGSLESMERFRLRLPEEVRRKVISGKLSRTRSCLVPTTQVSSLRVNRTGFSGSYREGSTRPAGL